MNPAAATSLSQRLFRVGGLRRQVADLEARAATLRATLAQEESAMMQEAGAMLGDLLEWPPLPETPPDPAVQLRAWFKANGI